MKTYISKNGLPLMWELLFVGSCFWVPGRYVIYTNFIFYLGITVYFLLKKDISFRQWGESLRSGGAFWKAVGLTIAGFAVAFGVAMTLEMLFLKMQGYSVDDIAMELGKQTDAVYKRLSRIKKKIKFTLA